MHQLDPNLNRNVKNYRYNHNYRNAAEITLPFINTKILKYAYKHNGNKLTQVMVAYLLEEMWQLHAYELCYNEAHGQFINEKQEKTLNNQYPNPKRCNTKSLWAPLSLVGQPTSWGHNLVILLVCMIPCWKSLPEYYRI